MSQAGNAPPGRSFTPRRADGPRRVRNGLKLAGILASNAAPDAPESSAAPSEATSNSLSHKLARSLLGLIEPNIEHHHLSAGLEYARLGQVVSLEFERGTIEAHVQGSAPRPYVTTISLPAPDEQQWKRIIDAMTTEALYAAKLLAGELPQNLDALFTSLDLKLLPDESTAVHLACSCPQGQSQSSLQGCKHAVAAAHLAAERLVQEPLSIFTLMGKSPEQLLELLRRTRTVHVNGATSAHAEADIPESQFQDLPLEACIDEFWRSSWKPRESDEMEHSSRTHIPHALLRRLGPSPLGGRFPLVGLLASVYDTVAAYAARIQQQQECAEEGVAEAE